MSKIETTIDGTRYSIIIFLHTTVFRDLKTSSRDRNLSLPSNIISRKQKQNTKRLSSKISIPIEYNLKPNHNPQEKEIAIK